MRVPAARSPAAAAMLLAACAVLFALAFETATDVRWLFFNSDVLLPAALVHDLFRAPHDALFFELPRVPSLFPDLLATLLLSAVLPGWRAVALCYGALSFTVLVLLCGTVTARFAGRPFGRSAAVFLSLAVLAMLFDLWFDHAWGAWTLSLFGVIHSGSLLCTLAGLLLVRRIVAGAPGVGACAALFVLVALATLSDRLFLATFPVPAVAGALVFGTPVFRRRTAVAAGVVAAVTAAGCGAGMVADRLLFGRGGLLLREPDLPIDLPLQWSRLPALLHEPSLYLQVAFVAVIVAAPARWAWRSAEGRFWWAASAGGSVALLGALPLIYIDWTSTRYMQPVWWWVPVTLSATLVRTAPRRAPLGAVLAAGLAGVAVLVGRADLGDVAAVMSWQHPVVACLRSLQASGTIHDGIAAYWVARPVEASSEWTLPVVQALGNGRPHFWGNNLRRYTANADGSPPRFDYIVLDQLEPDTILAHFGSPARRVPCGGTEVWLYDGDARLRTRLAAVDPSNSLLDTPAGFAPETLVTREGRVPIGGAVPPVAAPGIATWGPYAPLGPGGWRVVARYSLSGDRVPHGWEAFAAPAGPVLASGALEPGADRLLSALFEVPAGARLAEIRTFMTPDNRLVLPGIGLCPAAVPEADCVRATLEP